MRLPGGRALPFPVVARAELGRGFSTINRVDRRRVVSVTADVDQQVTTANEVRRALEAGVLDEVLADFPSVAFSFEGEQREQADSLQSLRRGFLLALFLI